jgi:hypothetical protein
MINNDNRTPSAIPNPSLGIWRDTPEPSWLGVGGNTPMRCQIYTRVSQIIQLIEIV